MSRVSESGCRRPSEHGRAAAARTGAVWGFPKGTPFQKEAA